MKTFRSLRLMLLAFLVYLVPVSSYAGVFISVGFAPPVLPVYVQPVCPEPGLMWTPGYWAYGDDGYYWVPGTWVPAPYVGALWTPGYWGWGGGLYAWHPGYWGPHVGYYGGVNYGFGYMGIGFAGGMWRGGVFAYNTAVMHVGVGGGWGNRVYVDRTIVEHNTIVNNNHVAFSGGPGGINHPPNAQENTYMHEAHQGPSSFQTQHESSARANVSSYASHNGGHPANVAMARPMGAGTHANIGSQSSGSGAGKINNTNQGNHGYTPQAHSDNPPQGGGGHNEQTPPKFNGTQPHNNVAPVAHNAPQFHPQPQVHENPTPQHSGGQPGGGQPQGGGQPHGGQPQGGGGHDHDHGH
jgi:hypothetical protein